MDRDSRARLSMLEERLDRVEALLARLSPSQPSDSGATASRSASPAASSTPLSDLPSATDAPSSRASSPPSIAAIASDAAVDHSLAEATSALSRDGLENAQRAGESERERLARKALAFRQRSGAGTSRPSIDWSRIESLIAGRWYALAGGLVVAIGVALFVQFAVKQGWLAQIPGSVRCALGAALGFALISTGEWARRRLNDWASVGLTAGGLGAVYVSAYASYALYELFSPGTTFLLLAAIGAMGVALSAITSLTAVAIVSLMGAYLAPIIASSGREGHAYVPSYWLVLLLVGLVLAVRKGGNFVLCRWLTVAATLGFGAAWCLEFAQDSPWIGLMFLSAAWATMHAELWFTARRADRKDLPELYERDFQRFEHRTPVEFFRTIRLRSISSLVFTSWAVLLALHVATQSGVISRSLPAAVGCATTLALAAALVGPRRLLNTEPSSRQEILATALVCASGSLLIATVAIALSGLAQALTLSALGLGALATSRLLRARALDLYAFAVLSVAALRVVFWDSFQLPRNTPAIELMGFHLTQWAASVAGVGVAWLLYSAAQIAAERSPDEPEGRMPQSLPLGSLVLVDWRGWRAIANFTLALGILLLGISLLHTRADAASLAVAGVTTALAIAVASRCRLSFPMLVFASILLLPAGLLTLQVNWLFAPGHAPFRSLTSEPFLSGIVFNARMLCGWYYAIVGLLVAWLLADGWHAGRILARLVSLSAAAMLGLAVVHSKSDASSLSLLWVALAAAFALGSRHVRAMALGVGASGLWTLAFFAWLVQPVLRDWAGAQSPPLLYAGLWVGLALAGVVLLVAFPTRQLLSSQNSGRVLASAWTICGLLILLSTSLEVARIAGQITVDATSRGAAVSVWWGAFALGMLVIGFVHRLPVARRAGLSLLALAVAKALIIDLANVTAGWRSVSVVVLGLFMIVVGIAYARISSQFNRRRDDQGPAEARDAQASRV